MSIAIVFFILAVVAILFAVCSHLSESDRARSGQTPPTRCPGPLEDVDRDASEPISELAERVAASIRAGEWELERMQSDTTWAIYRFTNIKRPQCTMSMSLGLGSRDLSPGLWASEAEKQVIFDAMRDAVRTLTVKMRNKQAQEERDAIAAALAPEDA